MKKRTFLLLLTLSVCALGADMRPVFKIGVIAPLTGNMSMLGEEAKNGIALAQEELHTGFDVKMIYEDDQFEGRQTNAAALKLLQLDRVDAIISIWDSAAMVVGPRVEKAGVLQFNAGWDPQIMGGKKWTMVHGGNYREFVRRSIEVMQIYHTKRLAIVGPVSVGDINCMKVARPLLKQAGIEVVFNEFYPHGTRDFRTYLLKVREAKPDFVWNLNTPPEDEIFWRSETELGLRWPTTGDFWVTTPDLYHYIDGALFPEIHVDPQFTARYKARFGYTPKMLESAICHDIYKMIVETAQAHYEKTGRLPTHEELLVELKISRLLPTLAINYSAMKGTGYVESKYVLKQVKDGKVVDYAPEK
jgi:ABC-type branched-subunit amino acid transport system substrate-binding protein